MKKMTSILALLLLGGFVLAGCGESTPTDSNNLAQPSNGGGDNSGGGSGNNGGGQQGGEQGGQQGGQQGGEQGGQQQGGEGGGGQQQGGEVPANSRFVNKKLRVSSISTSPQVAEMETAYNQAYISFFQDSSCELVAPHDNVYDVLFGTYGVNELDNVATISVLKSYDGLEELYSWALPTSLRTIIVEYVADSNSFTTRMSFTYPATTMTLTLSALPNPPMHIVGDGVPEDPNGNSFNDQYQVEQYYWDQHFKNDYLRIRNFTVQARVPSAYVPNQYETYTVEVDGMKYHLSYEDYPNAEQYFYLNNFIMQNEEIVGINVDVYSKDGENWRLSENVENSSDRFQDMIGFLPIPFLSTSYSEFTHCYSVSTLNYHDESTDLEARATQVKVYFEKTGNYTNIKKVTYKDEIQSDHEFNYSKHNATVVNLPDAAGQGGGGGSQGGSNSTDATSYYSEINNRVFTFKEAWGSGWEDEEIEGFATGYADATFSIFGDNSAEFHSNHSVYSNGTVTNEAFTYYGRVELTDGSHTNDNDPYVRGNFVQTHTLDPFGDYYEDSNSIPIRYYLNTHELRYQEYNQCFLQFNRTSTVPTHISHPESGGGGGGGEGTESVYPSTEIAAYLTGTTDTMPNLALEGASYEFHNPTGMVVCCSITYTLDSNEAYDMVDDLGYYLASVYSYGLKYSVEDEVLVYVSPNRQIGINAEANTANTLTISIYNFVVYTTTFLVDYEICDVDDDWDITKDGAVFFAWAWDKNGDGYWLAITMLVDTVDGVVYYFVLEDTPDEIIGMKVVRFNPNASELPEDKQSFWGTYAEGDIWNESNDIDLSGNNTVAYFYF